MFPIVASCRSASPGTFSFCPALAEMHYKHLSRCQKLGFYQSMLSALSKYLFISLKDGNWDREILHALREAVVRLRLNLKGEV